MAEDKDDGGLLSKLGGNGVLWLLLAAVGAAVLQQAPLLVEHPGGLDAEATRGGYEVRRDARLWQDPFELARPPRTPADRKLGDLPKDGPLALGYTLRTHAERQPPARTLVVVGSLPDGPYSELAERRRRIRVAVTEALLAEGFVAEDPAHLTLAATVPFEWFVPPERLEGSGVRARRINHHGPDRQVLVLWIAESSLADDPRGQLCRALLDLPPLAAGSTPAAAPSAHSSGPPARPGGDGASDDCEGRMRHVVVLGPGDSQGLESLVEVSQATPECSPPTASDSAVSVPEPAAAAAAVAGAASAPATAPAPPARPERLPHFYTGMATIPLEALHFGLLGSRTGCHGANTGLRGTGVTRTVATDEQVAEALVHELSLRSVNPYESDEKLYTLQELLESGPRQSDDTVALVTETDTPYGRAMPDAFCRAFRAAVGQWQAHDLRCEDLPDTRPGMYVFGYLRGLNGEVHHPGERGLQRASGATRTDGASGDAEPADVGGESPPGGSTAGRSQTPVERAEGNKQTDYLERLAERLGDLDDQLRQREHHPRRLRAIGLLGTDVYDKLMLLRALKPRFPGVVFFTTDLDARLLDASELAWTRNLVIASSFGLHLADRANDASDAASGDAGAAALIANGHQLPLDQAGFPDFRDTYQTAMFLTTRIAVRAPHGPRGRAQQACIEAWTRQVHVFEIGRNGMNELVPGWTHDMPDGDWACRMGRWSNPQPAPEVPGAELTPRNRAGLAMAFLALLCSGLLWGHPGTRAVLERSVKQLPLRPAASRLWLELALTVLAALVVSLLFAFGWPWVIDHFTDHGRGQPLAFAAGISVWPALLLVLLATLWWTRVLFTISPRLSANAREIHDTLGFPGEYRKVLANIRNGARRESLRERWARHMFPPSMLPPVPGGDLPVFWRLYLRSGLGHARTLRWSILGGMILVVFMILNDPLDNHLPMRGSSVELWYTGLNAVALGLLLLLMVAVADASLFCTDFLDHLGDDAAEWPWEAVRRAGIERGLRPALALPWLRLEITAMRTETITPLIYHPFLLIAVLIVSRSSLFSPWKISMQHLVVVIAVALAMVFCTLKLRASAERVRDATIDAISAELQRLQAAGHGKSGAIAQAQGLLRAARNDRRGALAPISEQPLIRSLVLPLLSLAGTSAAELASLWQ